MVAAIVVDGWACVKHRIMMKFEDDPGDDIFDCHGDVYMSMNVFLFDERGVLFGILKNMLFCLGRW